MFLVHFIMLVYTIGILLSMYRLYISYNWLRKEERLDFSTKLSNKFVLIVPVLREQTVILESLEHFDKLSQMDPTNIEVVYVTTSKEVKNAEILTTGELIEDYIENKMKGNLRVENYPLKKGVMAHQINWVLKKINDPNVIIGIYNVDSKISFDTLLEVDSKCKKEPNAVFQQYSLYKNVSNKILNQGVMWQNRWSILYELPKAICATRFSCKNKVLKIIFKEFNYVIGHGVYARNDIWKQVGGFPEDVLNEDNKLGYILNIYNIKIQPLVHWEYVGFAEKISVFIKQQSVWFNGPIYAFQYYKDVLKTDYNISKLEAFSYACRNFRNGLNWLFTPIIFSVACVLCFYHQEWFYLMGLIIEFWIFVSGFNILSNFVLNECVIHRKSSIAKILMCCFNSLFDYPYYIITCIGPILTVGRILLRRNTFENKYKTEK